MKNSILGLIAVLFAFNAHSQIAISEQPHLFLAGSWGHSDGMPRQMVDMGVAVKHSRFSLYGESFKTLPFYNKPEKHFNTGGYRKFFLGVRYARVIAVKHIVDVVPSVGLDLRLNGGNTQSTATVGTLGEVANMPSLRPAIGLERALSYNPCSVLSHIKLNVNRYYQVNFHRNTTRYVRPGVSAGIIVTF